MSSAATTTATVSTATESTKHDALHDGFRSTFGNFHKGADKSYHNMTLGTKKVFASKAFSSLKPQ